MDLDILHLKILTSYGQELKDLARRLDAWGGRQVKGAIYLHHSWFSKDEDVRRWCKGRFYLLKTRLNRGNKRVIGGLNDYWN